MLHVFAGICLCVGLCVCGFVNTIASEQLNIGRCNLGVGASYKITAKFEFGGHSPCQRAQPPKMWRFAESRCMTQNVNKAMGAGKTSHWAQRVTCLRLRRWENQRGLSSIANSFRYLDVGVSATAAPTLQSLSSDLQQVCVCTSLQTTSQGRT